MYDRSSFNVPFAEFVIMMAQALVEIPRYPRGAGPLLSLHTHVFVSFFDFLAFVETGELNPPVE